MFLLKEQKQSGPIQYDQNHLDIKITHGRTQLQEIKIIHSWKDPNIKYRLPKLRCQWFNKTETSMEQIKGIQQEFYQPSVLDVGTQIYIQIIPESKDLEYIGMPITKVIGPLQLAGETQDQTQELLETGKSTFFIEFKELSLANLEEEDFDSAEGKVALKECLLKIVGNKMIIQGKKVHSSKSQALLQIQIKSDYPQLQLDRACGKFLNILFSPSQYAILVLQNNKIRDVLFLLVKRIAEQNSLKKEDFAKDLSKQTIEDQKITQVEKENITKIKQQQKKDEETPLSPQTIEKDVAYLPSIASAEFKNKIVKLQEQNFKKTKQIEEYRIKTVDLTKHNAILQKEISSFKKELSEYQKKLNVITLVNQKQKEEMCYLRNQCRLKQQNLQSLIKKIKQLQTKLEQISRKYQLNEQQQIQYHKYSNIGIREALSLLLIKDKQIQQFSLKQSYKKSEQDQIQQQNIQLKSQLQYYESLNKNLTKKLQSVHQAQLISKQKASSSKQQQNNKLIFEISKSKEQISLKVVQIQSLNKDKNLLKGQIKELIEQNMVLRTKDKSSKNELKLEVVQLKKLVNRFAETITQKDQQICNLRMANKTLNTALLQTKK